MSNFNNELERLAMTLKSEPATEPNKAVAKMPPIPPRPQTVKVPLKDSAFNKLAVGARLAVVYHIYSELVSLDNNAKQPNQDVLAAMAKKIEECTRQIPLRALPQFFKVARFWKLNGNGFGLPSVWELEYCAHQCRIGKIDLPVIQKTVSNSPQAFLPLVEDCRLLRLPAVRKLASEMLKRKLITMDEEVLKTLQTQKKEAQNVLPRREEIL